ncbi:MAG: hypothetical protein Q8N65_02625 [bacterium]|nr:hypothetical protein [bacterium]
MLPPGHIAASYILVKSVELAGFNISGAETLVVLAASIVLDFDLLSANFLKRSHHDLISHTPLGAFILWLIFIFIVGGNLSPTGQILILLSLLLHLLLDEAGFWLYRLKLQGISREPQITWLYPRVKFPRRKDPGAFKLSFFKDYFQKAKANVFLEIILSLTALLMLWLI